MRGNNKLYKRNKRGEDQNKLYKLTNSVIKSRMALKVGGCPSSTGISVTTLYKTLEKGVEG